MLCLVLNRLIPLLPQYYTSRHFSAEELPETHKQLRKTCREFANSVLAPAAAKHDREHLYPTAAIHKMGELGLMSLMVPERDGGTGMDYLAYAIAMEEISRGDASAGVIMSAHGSLYLGPLVKYGNAKQKETFLAPYLNGKQVSEQVNFYIRVWSN